MYAGQLQNNVSSSFVFCASQDTREIHNVYDHSPEGIFHIFSQY